MAYANLELLDRRIVRHALNDENELLKADLEDLRREIDRVQLEYFQIFGEAEVLLV